jgi:hypothetical protein
MRDTTLDNIARRYPKITLIGARLGNPDYAWAAEIARWNPSVYWDPDYPLICCWPSLVLQNHSATRYNGRPEVGSAG